MSKATLTFNLPEENYEYLNAIHGSDWRDIVYELSMSLRNSLKHGHQYKTADEALEAIKTELWSLCNEYHLDPWES